MAYFTIVVPSYNRLRFLPGMWESVLAQTYTDWELLLIDDASTDQTQEWAQSIKDSRFHYLKNEVNRERSYSRNRGMKNAQGQYICLLDSDDTWHKTHLDTLHAFLAKENFPQAFLFTKHQYKNEKNDCWTADLPAITGSAVEYIINYQPATPCVCIHKAIIEQGFLFDEKFKINEDVYLYSRIAARFPVYNVPEVTVTVNLHSGSTTQSSQDIINPQIDVFHCLLRDQQVLPLLSDAFINARKKKLIHQRINYYHNIREYGKMNKDIIWFIWNYPRDITSKSKLSMLLYNLPLGNLLKVLYRRIKSFL